MKLVLIKSQTITFSMCWCWCLIVLLGSGWVVRLWQHIQHRRSSAPGSGRRWPEFRFEIMVQSKISFFVLCDLRHWPAANKKKFVGYRTSYVLCSVADPGCLSRIPDPDSHRRILVFLTQKFVYKLSEILSGMFIPDPDRGSGSWFFTHPGFRGQTKKEPDPGSGSATLVLCKY
jgi:hypothetical protein